MLQIGDYAHEISYFVVVHASPFPLQPVRIIYSSFPSYLLWPYRPCLNVEIESVHRICLLTDSVDILYPVSGPNDHLGNTVSLDSHAYESFPTPTHW